jgi:molybdenum cofactor cytidylyltransferase
MKQQSIEVKEAIGRTLCCTMFCACGEKLLAKGHMISEADARLLEAEGFKQVCVAELEPGEVGEDDAVMEVATEIGCGALEIRLAAGGRANLFTTEPSCVLVDDGLLKRINRSPGMAIATAVNFSHARLGQRVAAIKSLPFAVARAELDWIISLVKEQGPILQARPIRAPAVAILYTDPVNGKRAEQMFERVMLQRLARIGTRASSVLSAMEEEGAVARALGRLLSARPTAVVIASTTAPATWDDVIGRSLVRAGCEIQRFLAPVEPGNFFLLGYKGDVPIVSAPGCFRSAKPNIMDLMLPPLLARYRVSWWEVARLGHGGLLG